MAIDFERTGSARLVTTAVPRVGLGWPLTLACWFKTESPGLAGQQALMQIRESAGGVDYAGLQLSTNNANDPISAFSRESGVQNLAHASTSSGWLDTEWHHGCAVFNSSGHSSAFADGGSKGTVSTNNLGAPVLNDEFYIGAIAFSAGSTATNHFDGPIRDAGPKLLPGDANQPIESGAAIRNRWAGQGRRY